MTFFQANPVGRVLNRFAKDTQVLDETISDVGRDFLDAGCMCLSALVRSHTPTTRRYLSLASLTRSHTHMGR